MSSTRAILEALAFRSEVQARLAAMTFEALADGHARQLKLMQDRSRWIVAMCSRRAGKTQGIAGRFARHSLDRPRGNRVYLALTGGQARDIMWEPIWKPMCERWGLCSDSDHNETRMITTFPNGSRVRFAGTDDIASIKKELGAGLDEACVDEAQDQKDNVMRDLCVRILSNAMTDRRGTMIVSGVVPEVAAGYFWDLWKLSEWSKHNFSQMENPHLPHAMDELMEYLEKNPGLTIDSPVIQRERFGRFKYDKALTAYRYSPSLNGYQPEAPEWLLELFAGELPDYLAEPMRKAKLAELPFAHWTEEPVDGAARFGVMAAKPHPGIDRFSGAADPGTSDRASVSVIGWGETTEEVQKVFEWSTPRGAGMSLGQIAVWMAVANQHYDSDCWFWDPGSGKMEIDTFQGDYGLPVIRAAAKPEVAPNIRRVNDLMTKGQYQEMIGSAAEQDFTKARRDPNTPASSPWRWAPGHHPDPSESTRYAINGYYDEYEPPKPPKPIEVQKRERWQKKLHRAQATKQATRDIEDDEDLLVGDLFE